MLILANNDYQIFTMPATGGQRFQVTPNTAKPLECSSTGPRGSHIVYSGYDGSDYEIFTIPANGGTPVQVTFNNTDDRSPSWQPRVGINKIRQLVEPPAGGGDRSSVEGRGTGGAETR